MILTRLHDIRHIAADRENTSGSIRPIAGRRYAFEATPGAIGIAQSKVIPRLLVRFESLAKGLEKRLSIVRVQRLQNPALLHVLSQDLIEGTRDERGTVRAHEDQSTLAVEFENQVRGIPDQRAVAALGIAQFSGLLAELLSKLTNFVYELRSVFIGVFAQRVISWWEADQSAPT